MHSCPSISPARPFETKTAPTSAAAIPASARAAPTASEAWSRSVRSRCLPHRVAAAPTMVASVMSYLTDIADERCGTLLDREPGSSKFERFGSTFPDRRTAPPDFRIGENHVSRQHSPSVARDDFYDSYSAYMDGFLEQRS